MDDKRVVWCQEPLPEFARDDDWADQWYLGARFCPLVRRGRDVIILPGGKAPVREFVTFCAEHVGFDARQVLWTSGTHYLMSLDVRVELMDMLRRIPGIRDYVLCPYSVTDEFLEWATELGAPIFGDDCEWAHRYNTKAILHPNAIAACRRDGVPVVAHAVSGVHIPRGRTCTNHDELRRGCEQLAAQGVCRFVIKPVHGSTGQGIRKVAPTELSRYDFSMGDVVLEEMLEIDRAAGRPIAVSVQFNGRALLDGMTLQLLDGMAYVGSNSDPPVTSAFKTAVDRAAHRLLDFLKPRGPGGFDFLSVQGEPVWVDPNLGRFTAVHPVKMFAHRRAPGMHFVSGKVEPRISVWELWERLRRRRIALGQRTDATGVFPMCYLTGMYGMLIAFACTGNDAQMLFDDARACLE